MTWNRVTFVEKTWDVILRYGTQSVMKMVLNQAIMGDGAASTRRKKENLIPLMLLAGLTSTATRSKKNARTLADTKLEMEVISQCGSGGLDDYKPSRSNMARMKLGDNSTWSTTVGSQYLTQSTWGIPPGLCGDA